MKGTYKDVEKQREIWRRGSARYRLKHLAKWREDHRRYSANHRKRNPLKVAARSIVGQAIRAGLVKKLRCFCGSRKTEAHHEDYSKPLEIVWYCRPHHRAVENN